MGLFILSFIDFLFTSNNIRVQVILGWNSQVKEPWRTLQFESQMFYIPQENVFPGHIWEAEQSIWNALFDLGLLQNIQIYSNYMECLEMISDPDGERSMKQSENTFLSSLNMKSICAGSKYAQNLIFPTTDRSERFEMIWETLLLFMCWYRSDVLLLTVLCWI